MKKFLLTTVFIVFISNTIFSQVYYVSGTGSSGNNGTSPSTPKRQISEALALITDGIGGTINVMDGNYNSFSISKKGTAANNIVITNFMGSNPVIRPSISSWEGISIDRGAAYITINGIELIGNNDQITLTEALNQPQSCANMTGSVVAKFNINAIDIDAASGNQALDRQHHIVISNCKVHDFGGAGLNAIKVDYIRYSNNIVYNNAWYTIYGGSGINVYQPISIDTNTTEYKYIIENNISYNNELRVPWRYGGCKFTDGNGIILDDFKHTQNGSTFGPYAGKTIVRNNVVYNNGGSGIHSFKSTNIDIINNTAYKNSTTLWKDQAANQKLDDGEIYAYDSNNIRIVNNIMFAETTEKVNTNNNPINTNYLFRNNLLWGGTTTTDVEGTSIQKNPLFIDAAAANFRLQSTSPAINKGNSTIFSSTDILGANALDTRDIGAYESSVPFVAPTAFVPNNLLVLTTPIISNPTVQAGRYYEPTIQEHTTSGTIVGDQLKLNILVDDRRLSLEGVIHLSEDRNYVLAVGRTGFEGTVAAPASSLGIRHNSATIVSRINNNKLIETTSLPGILNGTFLTPAFNGESARGAVSVDGSSFYVNTGNAAADKGTQNIVFGATATTPYAASANRGLGTFGGKIFQVSQSGVVQQDNVNLNLTNTTGTLTEIVVLDVDATIAGLDLMYIGDRDNGILKYYFNGTSWIYAGVANGAIVPGGFNALTGRVEGGKPTLYGIKIDNTDNFTTDSQLVKVVDDLARTEDWSIAGGASFTSLIHLTSNPTKMMRGVCFTPNTTLLSTNNNDISITSDIILFPNPSKGSSFNLKLPKSFENVEVSINNMLGQTIYTQKENFAEGVLSINPSVSITPGMYLVTLKSNGFTITKNWIVQ